MIDDAVGDKVNILLDEAADDRTDGLDSEAQRKHIHGAVKTLLNGQPRDLDAEADALIQRVQRQQRRSRRQRMALDLGYLIDAFTESEDAAYVDPMLCLAYPLGTHDGQVKQLRYWVADDFRESISMAYRNAAETTAAAVEHDNNLTAAIKSMQARGVTFFGHRP